MKGYSVKSFLNEAYVINYPRQLEDHISKFIWQKNSTPRAELTVWLMVVGRLKIGSYLKHVGLIDEEKAR